jgi:hypothetical protein
MTKAASDTKSRRAKSSTVSMPECSATTIPAALREIVTLESWRSWDGSSVSGQRSAPDEGPFAAFSCHPPSVTLSWNPAGLPSSWSRTAGTPARPTWRWLGDWFAEEGPPTTRWLTWTAGLRRSGCGTLPACWASVNNSSRCWSGWRIRGWFEWLLAVLSCAIFLLLEGGLLYSYYQFLKHGQW